MFCPNCGKTIDDNAPFCGFCGATTGVAASAPAPASELQPAQPVIPQNPAPASPAPQNTVPQYAAPQNPVPQYAAAPKPASSFKLNLDPQVASFIRMAISAILAVLAVLVLIGSIGTLATLGKINSYMTYYGDLEDLAAIRLIDNLLVFVNLARTPAIISFGLAVCGAVVAYTSKQKIMFPCISAGVGLIMFVFNFLLVQVSSMYALYKMVANSVLSYLTGSSSVSFGAPIVGSIFLLISSLLMIACSAIVLLKKESIVPNAR